jgi:hypothetical protein
MGQIDLVRTEFKAWEAITTPANSAVQPMAFTGYYDVGDVVDVNEVDADGNIVGNLVSGATIAAITPNVALIFTAAIDTTAVTPGNTAQVFCLPIDDGQEAIDRLYHRPVFSGEVNFERSEPVLSSVTVGGTKLKMFVADVSFFQAGDVVDIVGTVGVPVVGVTVDSVSVQSDDTGNKAYIMLTTNPSIAGITLPEVVLTGVSVSEMGMRVMGYVDNIDKPIENEYLGVGDNKQTVWAFANLFKQSSSKIYLDGVRKRLGTTGTRATYTHGTSDAALTVTSMVLGLKGNACKLAITTGVGAPVPVVTGTYAAGFTVTVNNNAGGSSAQLIAEAINASATAKLVMEAQWGGDGTGFPATLSATAMTGGLNNGSGDYAEIEQVFENVISATGFKFIAFWILPTDPNRMNVPPKQSEEIVVDYRMLQFNK